MRENTQCAALITYAYICSPELSVTQHHRDAGSLDMREEAANPLVLGQSGHMVNRSLLHREYAHFLVFCSFCSINAT